MPARDPAEADTLYLLRPFLKSLTANLPHHYKPYSRQTARGARNKYKGYTSLKQYMPMKSIKHVMKRGSRADSY